MAEAFLISLIVLALAFDFINGFHDAANSVATVVSTRVLKPSHAVIWAAFFNFIAFLFFETKVANTIGKGLIDTTQVDSTLIFAALFGATVWNLITWYQGIPSSSSHALVGGLVGAAFAKSGLDAVHMSGLLIIVISIVASPLLGMGLGFLLMQLTKRLIALKAPAKVDKWFRKLQLLSAALYSLGHGGNDAQKTMGVIAILLFSAGHLGNEFHVPIWVVLSCQTAMALGTLLGGWRIVKTMGTKITKLKPVGGFCAETSGAASLFLATALGIPVSTTHTITGSIVGVGLSNRRRTVRWVQANRIVIAWVITIPIVSAFSYLTFMFAALSAG